MSRLRLALAATCVVAITVVVTTASQGGVSCDPVGTWEAAAYRINGGEMKLADEGNLLIFNSTHWARLSVLDGHAMASAGTYEVKGDSLVWQYEIGGDHRISEACRVDSDGLHLANEHGSNQDGTPTVRETDYRRVEAD